MATTVYRYGLLPPTENGALVRERMRCAHAYYNALVEIERGRRAARRGVENGAVVALEQAAREAEAAAVEAARELKASRARTRSRSETAEQSERVAATGRIRREALSALRTARAEAQAGEAATLKGIDERAYELGRAARAASGLARSSPHGANFGTYLLVEDRIGRARRAPLYDGTEPNDPRFARWDGTGRIAVQIQAQSGAEPFLTARVFDDDTRLRIDPVDERAWLSPSRGERRRFWRTVLHVRVGSSGRDPIWASFPMVMHRPLPPDGVIKWAVVKVDRVGPREEWSLHVTVTDAPRKAPAGSGGAVAVHLGWLDEADGLRVATWMDETGESGFLHLGAEERAAGRPRAEQAPGKKRLRDMSPEERLRWKADVTLYAEACRREDAGDRAAARAQLADRGDLLARLSRRAEERASRRTDGERGGVISGIRKADELRSVRDRNFNAARAAFADWMRLGIMPEWMRALTVRRGSPIPSQAQALAYLDSWRAPARLAALALRWRGQRFEADAEGYDALEAWRYHDRHLWEWETSQRTSALRRRREVFRCFAARLAATYGTVILDDANYAAIARRPGPEQSGGAEQARANRTAAAVSELRLALRNAFGPERVKTVPSADLTRTCPACGAADPAHRFDSMHKVQCGTCTFGHGVTGTSAGVDQSHVALWNMLRRAGLDDEVTEIIERRESVLRRGRGLALLRGIDHGTHDHHGGSEATT